MNNENDNNLNFNEVLNILDNASKESFVKEAWIPSLKRTVKIKEINAKQQKSIIESAIDSAVIKSTFSKVFYDIVCSNCLEEKSVIESFTIVDKASIAFSMRSQISDNIKVLFKEDPKIEGVVSLNDILNRFNSYTHPTEKTIRFSKNGVNIDVVADVPLFSDEAKFDSVVYGKNKSNDQVEEIKSIITGAFLGETAKYIKEIVLNGSVFNYKSLQTIQKIQFVEKLPASLVQNILEKILEWKEDLDKICTVHNEGNSKLIEVNSLLFLTN
jgi:hypothetical protein